MLKGRSGGSRERLRGGWMGAIAASLESLRLCVYVCLCVCVCVYVYVCV
jgi:hypothetical protein